MIKYSIFPIQSLSYALFWIFHYPIRTLCFHVDNVAAFLWSTKCQYAQGFVTETKKRKKGKDGEAKKGKHFRNLFENLREFYNLHSYVTIRQRRFMYIG